MLDSISFSKTDVCFCDSLWQMDAFFDKSATYYIHDIRYSNINWAVSFKVLFQISQENFLFENIKHNCHPVSGTFYYFNSIINPFLYSIMSKRFRRAFKELQAAFICKYFVVKSTSNSSSKENVECSGNKITKCKK